MMITGVLVGGIIGGNCQFSGLSDQQINLQPSPFSSLVSPDNWEHIRSGAELGGYIGVIIGVVIIAAAQCDPNDRDQQRLQPGYRF